VPQGADTGGVTACWSAGFDERSRSSGRVHPALIIAVQAHVEVHMSSLIKLLLVSVLGVAAAAAVVAIHSKAADAIGGAVVIVSLIVVTRSAIRMAGDSGSPEDGGAKRGRPADGVPALGRKGSQR
jgi:hypothetical protein